MTTKDIGIVVFKLVLIFILKKVACKKIDLTTNLAELIGHRAFDIIP